MGEKGRRAGKKVREECLSWPEHLCSSHPLSFIEILIFSVIVMAGGSLGDDSVTNGLSILITLSQMIV